MAVVGESAEQPGPSVSSDYGSGSDSGGDNSQGPACAGILLTVLPSSVGNGAVSTDLAVGAARELIQGLVRGLEGSLRVISVTEGPGGYKVLAELEQETARCLADAVTRGAWKHQGVLRARVVDLEEYACDIELVRRMLLRDESALARLFARNAPGIERSLNRRFDELLGPDEVASAVNLAACKLWRSVSKFDPDTGSLGAWFYRIAEHEVYNSLRRFPGRDVPLEFDPEHVKRLPFASSSHRTNRQLLNDLNEIIDQLKGQQRVIVLADLAAGERASDEQLAALLETSVETIRVQRSKAKRKIQDQLRERGHDLSDPEPEA
ncbi:MAG: sigma-70 family RNA polymerase sigma factor [Pirellulaceae bacterium]|nr:sigma-70 family RNA polymerase sigma factor [Pirellulaceae bacterium]